MFLSPTKEPLSIALILCPVIKLMSPTVGGQGTKKFKHLLLFFLDSFPLGTNFPSAALWFHPVVCHQSKSLKVFKNKDFEDNLDFFKCNFFSLFFICISPWSVLGYPIIQGHLVLFVVLYTCTVTTIICMWPAKLPLLVCVMSHLVPYRHIKP